MKLPVFGSTKIPFFILLFCCFASAILGDSTAEALLLANWGAGYIPQLFLVNALLLFVTSTMMISVIDRVDRGTLFIGFALVHAGVLALIRLVVISGATFLYLPLFSYAYVTKIMLFMMFWTLANDLIDSRRAGSEFPFIAAGGTLGAILISFSIPWLLKVVNAENLLWIWSGATACIALLFIPLRMQFGVFFKPASAPSKRSGPAIMHLGKDIGLLRSEPMLGAMALLYFLIFFIIPNQHFLFYSQLKNHFINSTDQAGDMARFLGYFNGISMFITFILQMTVASTVLKRFGSTRALFILPSVLTLVFLVLTLLTMPFGGVAMLSLQTVFWAVVMGVGIRIGFFDSFYSPNFQIFFSSLPKSIRGRGKMALEGAVKPVAIVTAGIFMSAVVPRIPLWGQMAVLMGASAALIFATLRLKHTYTRSLSQHLRSVTTKNTQWLSCVISNAPRETVFVELLRDILTKEEQTVKEYVIEILTMMNSQESKKLLLDQLKAADDRTRANIVSALSTFYDPQLKPVYLDLLLRDANERVLANCIQALVPYADNEICLRVKGFLGHENSRVRSNAVLLLWPTTPANERQILDHILRKMIVSESNDDRASALYVMGEVKYPGLIDEIRNLQQVYDTELLSHRNVWKQYVLALAKSNTPQAIEVLLSLASAGSRKQRNDLSIALRLLIKKGTSIDHFINSLTLGNYLQRNSILRAIYTQQVDHSREGVKLLRDIATQEIRAVHGDWLCISAIDAVDDPAMFLLRNAIHEECIAERLQNLFYLASMLDEEGQVRRIIHRLYHANKYVRARAYEVLDNAGDFRTNRWIIKLLESDSAADHVKVAHDEFNLVDWGIGKVIQVYRNSPSAWVSECARYAAQACETSTYTVRN